MSNFNFPTELLTEILLKLPVKSLIRFTIVCKSWQSLITSPTFIFSHLSNTENHALVHQIDRDVFSLLKITETGLDSSSELEFPFKSIIPYNRVVDSCDGLLCLSDDFLGNPSLSIIIWNPSVRNHVVLPNPIINPKEPYIRVLGFGVANHVYKVVSLVYNTKPENVSMQAEIFSFSSTTMGRWRSVTTFGISHQIRHLHRLCYLHQLFLKGVGVVHWLAFEGTNVSVLTFKVGDEVFGEVMLPDELSRTAEPILRLFVIGESLGVTGLVNGSCDVWMMKEYGVKESWTKLHRIDFVVRNIIDFSRSGKAQWVLIRRLLPQRELVAYNPETRGIKNLGIYGIQGPFYLYNYVESLILLRGYSGAADEDIDEDIEN